VVPGLTRELGEVPAQLAPFWQEGFRDFHPPGWWRELWESTGRVQIEHCALVPHGHADWLLWSELSDQWKLARDGAAWEHSSTELLRADTDQLLGFVAMTARKL
jgi:hypothetical protein